MKQIRTRFLSVLLCVLLCVLLLGNLLPIAAFADSTGASGVNGRSF